MTRTYDDVVEIVHPDPDSQWRLRACKCGSAEVVYAKYTHADGVPRWRVVCTDCGASADLHGTVRHEVQVEWNRRNNCG